MRSKEEIKRLRQQAHDSLKKDFLSEKKPVKKESSKKFGKGSFGK
jgi:hypothetical protein